jgi:hypothetical protein
MPFMSVYQRPFTSPAVRGGVLGRSGLGAFWSRWLPSSLFAAGEQGAWYDPSDLSSLFQDSAGTIPVTTAGDPVGRMLDKSGRGNHATQTVSASRPTYQTDGTLRWLAFDGVDDHLVTTQNNPFVYTDPLFIFAGFNKTGAFKAFETLYGSATNTGATNTGQSIALQVAAGKLSTDVWAPGGIRVDTPLLVAGTPYVVGVTATNWSTHKNAGGALRTNGAQGTSVAYGGAQTGLTAVPAYLGVFHPTALASSFYTGAMFGVIAARRSISAPETLSLESYLAKKSGVTL